jgi:hypothetical protein
LSSSTRPLVEAQLDVFSAWRLTHTANAPTIPMIVASTSSVGTMKRWTRLVPG